MFTAETNQIEEKFLKKERTVRTLTADRKDEFSTRYRADECRTQHSQRQLHTNHEKEQTYKLTTVKQ